MTSQLQLSAENRSCVAANRYRCRSPRVIDRSFRRSPGADHSPSTRSSTLASYSRSSRANGFRRSPPGCGATGPPSGGSVAATSRAGWTCCWPTPRCRDVPRRFPPLQRAQIVELACLEPVAEGLHITHWTSADLARQAVADGIVPAISPGHGPPDPGTTWTCNRTARDTGGPRASMRGSRSGPRRCCGAMPMPKGWPGKGIWTVAVDEVPNFQVLEREPIRRAIPGFDRAAGVRVHPARDGQPAVVPGRPHRADGSSPCGATKDAEHYIRGVAAFRRRHRGLKGVFLIQDGDPSHTAGETRRPTGRVAGVVAAPVHAGPRLVAEPGGVVGPGPSGIIT